MKTLCLLILFVIASCTYAQVMGNYFKPDKADTITVTGKVIVEISHQHPLYFLDTNSDNQPDYNLNLGPWWYKPDSTVAQRPNNGDVVTVQGGYYMTGMYQFPTIIVYEINGQFWRDPFFAQWNNMGHHNHQYPWMGHGHYQGGYGFGWIHDSLKTIDISGNILIDTTFYMFNYYLDTNNDSNPDYFLNFGPFWYNPENGTLRPVEGETVTIKGGSLDRNTNLPMIIVYEINGQTWRDSIKLFPNLGGVWMHSSDTSRRFYCAFDFDDYAEMHQGWHMGGMNQDSLFCQIFESYPENMPDYSEHNIFAGYEIDMFYPNGMNGMWDGEHGGGHMNFRNNISFQFHYTDQQLQYYGMNEDQIKIISWNSRTKSWEEVNGFVDKQNNIVKLSVNTVSNFYALAGQSVTTVKNNNNIQNQFILEQNYPNPFNPATIIKYSIPSTEFVTLKVYNTLGKEVATLINEEQTAGNHSVEFNGSFFASGIYLFKIRAGNFLDTKKMALVK